MEMKDSIDFGGMNLGKLFRKLLLPTLVGMVFSAIFVITDGIFVGHGIGSDALAAVNITAPLFTISTGIALMFGAGGAVVASIHLSRGKRRTASINMTQAVAGCAILMGVLSITVMALRDEVLVFLGSSERLMPLAKEYLEWFTPFLPCLTILTAGTYFVRMDGAPRYAMMCNVTAAVINIILDYVFIFPLGWGMFGAALATSLGYVVGAMMIIYYLWRRGKEVRFTRIKMSRKSLKLTLRNIGYMCNMGFSSLLSEGAISCMMFVGNYVFMRHLGEDGVAAYSIVCYLFPIIFLAFNSVGQSAQPIWSFNYGKGDTERVQAMLRMAMKAAVGGGIVIAVALSVCRTGIVGMFLPPEAAAYGYAAEGLPLFASGMIFCAVNIVLINYLQSIERPAPANFITLLRGYMLLVLTFVALPEITGSTAGMWLAVPAAEALTCMVSIYFIVRGKRRR